MSENLLPAFGSDYVTSPPDHYLDFDMDDMYPESFFPGSDILAKAGTLPKNGAGTDF